MVDINAQIIGILSNDVFKSILNNDIIQIEKLCLIEKILIAAGIPFDLSFSPGTRRVATAAELIIYINPTTTLNFIIALEGGGSIFGGAPGV